MDFYIGRKNEKEFTIPSTTFLTHTAVMGASGSGKTVICKSIVEEAIMAGIPVIAIDPKGDIGGLGIGFGDFSKERIIIHAQVEATDRGGDADIVAQEWIDLYKKKLEADFGEDYLLKEQEFSDKVASILITPKNASGLQISLIPSFEKPGNYDELMTESPDVVLSSIDLKIQLLLARGGIGASSSTDNRVIFINNIVRHLWDQNQKIVELADIIDRIETPPFEKIGSLDVEKFISKAKRSQLSQSINALMVRAVGGIDLNFDELINLAKKEKKTPIIVFDLRKITDDDEKNTFVAQVLGEVQRWAWNKGGTSRLRALLYFDELYGFMPAGSSTPPSKTALLILLKQARSAGLGIVVASQNPGDLDYRGLSNIATWVLGRLATNQDIAKIQGALKPVFEGEGGTEEEFKELMNSIRALKPGEFVIYNSRVGVQQITTRWLLSLHKGPLTNKEIKALTLRPPEKIAKTKSDSNLTKKRSKKTDKSEEEAPREIVLVSKKPSVSKKQTERFIKPRINPNTDNFIKRFYGRLSITGNEKKDEFKIELGQKTLFYSPIYFSKTEIGIKRTIKENGLEIPIAIGDVMIRTYDLTKSINWNIVSVEGIHPAGLLPQELELAPLKEFQFNDLNLDIADKLPENLIWYYSSSPFPEADRLYLAKLREYERDQLEKLGGKSKEFTKLTLEISKHEERIEIEKVKIKEMQERLEFLEGEKQAREAEGRSTKALERSLESTEMKKAGSEEIIRELQEKIATAEKERKNQISEQTQEYEKFEKTIAKMKQKGTPSDLYKPDKADIKIVEDVIYWVPRILLPVKLSKEETDFQEIINFNLYNGNAEISCTSCGPSISTENYYQSLLQPEISPPSFICNVDLKFFCSDHVGFCSNCSKTVCLEHIQQCSIDKEQVVCSNCKITCTSCELVVCPEHSWTCAECNNVYCSNEDIHSCSECNEDICLDCTPKVLAKCVQCNKMKCKKDHSTQCKGCNKIFCNEHLSKCKNCNEMVCNDCGRVKVKLKGEDIIARCVICS
jgi:hypothetical protein